MNAPPRIALVGITGFGGRQLRRLLDWHREGVVTLVALVDLRLDDETAELVRGEGAQFFDSLSRALERTRPDAVVVATPLSTHAGLAATVLAAGCALYLEKPPVATLDELDVLARNSVGRRVEIGFQDTPRAVRTVLEHLPLVGRVQRISACGALRRPDAYFRRNAGAGRWFLHGVPVFDGPLSGPLAHVVHSALVLAAEVAPGWTPGPPDVRSFRVHEIEGDDLTVWRSDPLGTGPVVVAAGTTAADEVRHPELVVHGENGELRLQHHDVVGSVRRHDGQTIAIAPAPAREPLREFVLSPRGRADPWLGVEAVRPFVGLTEAAVRQVASAGGPVDLRSERVQQDEVGFWLGASRMIDDAVRSGLLPDPARPLGSVSR